MTTMLPGPARSAIQSSAASGRPGRRRVRSNRHARDRDGLVADDGDVERECRARWPLGNAIDFVLHRTGIGVNEDGEGVNGGYALFASARRTAFGSALMTSISVRAAPEGRRVPSSHLRTVPTPVPIRAANSPCDSPSL